MIRARARYRHDLHRMSPEARQRWLAEAALALGLERIRGGVTFDPHTNFAYSTVQAGSTIISSTGNPRTIVLPTGEGAVFPGGDGTTQFNAVVWPSGARPLSTNAEIVRATRSGDTITTTARAQEGTSALSGIAAGYQVMAAVTAKTATDIETAAVHFPRTRTTPATAVNNTTTETDLLAGAFTSTGAMPGGLIGANGSARFEAWGDALNNTGANQLSNRWRFYLGGTLLFDTDVIPINTQNPWGFGAARTSWRVQVIIQNAGATNSQDLLFKLEHGWVANIGSQVAFATGNGRHVSVTGGQELAIATNTGSKDTTTNLNVELKVIQPTASVNLETKLIGARLQREFYV